MIAQEDYPVVQYAPLPLASRSPGSCGNLAWTGGPSRPIAASRPPPGYHRSPGLATLAAYRDGIRAWLHEVPRDRHPAPPGALGPGVHR